MKKLFLLFALCTVSTLAFAQNESSYQSGGGGLGDQLSTGSAQLSAGPAFARNESSSDAPDQGTTQPLVTNGCVSLTPDSRDFGNQPVDFPSASKPFYLQNGCNANLRITNINAESQSFSQSNNCLGTLLPNHMCEIDVVFHPISAGDKSQNLVVTYYKQGNPNSMQISAGLTGDGEHDLTFNPTSCDFGEVKAQYGAGICVVMVQNEEPRRLEINACHVSGLYFSQDSACPIYLAPMGDNGDSVNIIIVFRPLADGLFIGTFQVTTDSPEEQESGTPYAMRLVGVGVP